MRGVILDAESLGKGIDLTPVTSLLDEWQVYPYTSPDEVTSRVLNADVVLTNKIRLDRTSLNLGSIRFISVMATGTNNVDLQAAHDHNITVSNAVAYGTPSVVQHTLSLILMLSTNLHRYLRDVKEGRWQQSPVFTLLDHPIVEISGKNLGIVGYGELGHHVALAAKALGLNILISERQSVSEPEVRSERCTFNDVLEQSDYLSLHCPLSPETAHMINAETLRQMKPTAFLINTARGGLIDSLALIEALEKNIIAGAAIDVLNVEPPTNYEPLLHQNHLSNLLVTPHNAWGAVESRQRLVNQMRENIEAFLAGKPVRQVN